MKRRLVSDIISDDSVAQLNEAKLSFKSGEANVQQQQIAGKLHNLPYNLNEPFKQKISTNKMPMVKIKSEPDSLDEIEIKQLSRNPFSPYESDGKENDQTASLTKQNLKVDSNKYSRGLHIFDEDTIGPASQSIDRVAIKVEPDSYQLQQNRKKRAPFKTCIEPCIANTPITATKTASSSVQNTVRLTNHLTNGGDEDESNLSLSQALFEINKPDSRNEFHVNYSNEAKRLDKEQLSTKSNINSTKHDNITIRTKTPRAEPQFEHDKPTCSRYVDDQVSQSGFANLIDDYNSYNDYKDYDEVKDEEFVSHQANQTINLMSHIALKQEDKVNDLGDTKRKAVSETKKSARKRALEKIEKENHKITEYFQKIKPNSQIMTQPLPKKDDDIIFIKSALVGDENACPVCGKKLSRRWTKYHLIYQHGFPKNDIIKGKGKRVLFTEPENPEEKTDNQLN